MTEELGDEILAYVVSTQTAHSLSREAASVWRACNGDASATDIASRLGLDEPTVAQALEQLSDAQLIDAPDNGLSRREASKRMAKLGAAVLSAPLIYSVAIPPVSAAATLCTSNCPDGAVIPCGTCPALPMQIGQTATCSSGKCYQSSTDGTCYCTSEPCLNVSPCGAGGLACCGACDPNTNRCIP